MRDDSTTKVPEPDDVRSARAITPDDRLVTCRGIRVSDLKRHARDDLPTWEVAPTGPAPPLRRRTAG